MGWKNFHSWSWGAVPLKTAWHGRESAGKHQQLKTTVKALMSEFSPFLSSFKISSNVIPYSCGVRSTWHALLPTKPNLSVWGFTMPKGFGIGHHIREIPGTSKSAPTFGHTVLVGKRLRVPEFPRVRAQVHSTYPNLVWYTSNYEILTSRPLWKPGKACWNSANLRSSSSVLTRGYPAPADRTCSRRSRIIWKRNVRWNSVEMKTINMQYSLWWSEYPFQDELVKSSAQVKDHLVAAVQQIHSRRVDAFVAQLMRKENRVEFNQNPQSSFGEPVISAAEGWRSPCPQDLRCRRCRWARRRGRDPDKCIEQAVGGKAI